MLKILTNGIISYKLYLTWCISISFVVLVHEDADLLVLSLYKFRADIDIVILNINLILSLISISTWMDQSLLGINVLCVLFVFRRTADFTWYIVINGNIIFMVTDWNLFWLPGFQTENMQNFSNFTRKMKSMWLRGKKIDKLLTLILPGKYKSLQRNTEQNFKTEVTCMAITIPLPNYKCL